jgi:hypothetical protein
MNALAPRSRQAPIASDITGTQVWVLIFLTPAGGDTFEPFFVGSMRGLVRFASVTDEATVSDHPMHDVNPLV